MNLGELWTNAWSMDLGELWTNAWSMNLDELWANATEHLYPFPAQDSQQVKI